MGKPSSTQLSTQSNSNKSNKKNRSKHKIKKNISTQKMDTMKKKKRNRNRKNIRKLFQKLKNDSMKTSTTDTTQDSVILLDSSANNTVESQNNTVIPQNKRKSPIIFSNSNKKKRDNSNSSLIILNDDLKTNAHSSRILSPKSSNSNNSHVNCSTPITKRDSGTIKRMIINNFCPPSSSYVKPKCEEIVNLDETDTTKIINRDSYLTIDLTSDSDVNKSTTGNNENEGYCTMETQDCTLVSVSDASVSMSGDSDVTVIQNRIKDPKNKEIQRFASGISNLNSSEKGKLLMLITKKILNGCNMPSDIKESLNNIRTSVSRSIETVEDTYIREIILGETKQPGQVSQVKSRNSIGSNIYHPKSDSKNRSGLRMVVIDGSNVAMDHKKGKSFSVQGLKICIDYFVKRGHTVKAFVPRFRCKYGKSSDPRLLDILERQGLVVYTPSREIQGKMCSPYDDRYIVQCAAEFDGVIVSGDNYRDLLQENPRWRFVIENRLLQFTWVDDMIMFPRDPLGRNGPTLEEFLKHTEITEPPIVL